MHHDDDADDGAGEAEQVAALQHGPPEHADDALTGRALGRQEREVAGEPQRRHVAATVPITARTQAATTRSRAGRVRPGPSSTTTSPSGPYASRLTVANPSSSPPHQAGPRVLQQRPPGEEQRQAVDVVHARRRRDDERRRQPEHRHEQRRPTSPRPCAGGRGGTAATSASAPSSERHQVRRPVPGDLRRRPDGDLRQQVAGRARRHVAVLVDEDVPRAEHQPRVVVGPVPGRVRRAPRGRPRAPRPRPPRRGGGAAAWPSSLAPPANWRRSARDAGRCPPRDDSRPVGGPHRGT